MKNKFSKRVLCLLCCFSLTLGAFACKPTKAEASFVSGAAALGCAVLISTIIGTTADMVFDDVVTENIGNVIDPFVQEFVEFEGNVFENVTDLYTTIAADSNPLAAGVLALSGEAGALIARFIDWLREEKGVVSGGEPLNFYHTYGSSFTFSDGTVYDFLSIDSYNYKENVFVSIDEVPQLLEWRTTYELANGASFVLNNDGWDVYDSSGTNLAGWSMTNWNGYRTYYFFVRVGSFSDDGITFYENYVWPALYNSSINTFAITAFKPIDYDSVFSVEGASSADFFPLMEQTYMPNEIPAGQSLTVNTGLTDLSFEDEQAAADSIFSAVLAGTLSPTVAFEDTATDTPGTDTDDSILSWTKKIWQAVTDLPADIASAIGGAISSSLEAAFAPDAALINEMTTAFSAKFGFVDTLKQVGDDFFGMTPDTQPPVVYIHLEDAEGAYNYGGTVKALDMTWYQRYKADVDRILGGFLWIAYLWMLFRRAPDILAGAGLVLSDSSYIDSVQGENGERLTFRRSKHL